MVESSTRMIPTTYKVIECSLDVCVIVLKCYMSQTNIVLNVYHDQMPGMFPQYLAIYNNVNWPKSTQNFPKNIQKFATY